MQRDSNPTTTRRSPNIPYIGDQRDGGRVSAYVTRHDDAEGCDKEFWCIEDADGEHFLRCGGIAETNTAGRPS